MDYGRAGGPVFVHGLRWQRQGGERLALRWSVCFYCAYKGYLNANESYQPLVKVTLTSGTSIESTRSSSDFVRTSQSEL